MLEFILRNEIVSGTEVVECLTNFINLSDFKSQFKKVELFLMSYIQQEPPSIRHAFLTLCGIFEATRACNKLDSLLKDDWKTIYQSLISTCTGALMRDSKILKDKDIRALQKIIEKFAKRNVFAPSRISEWRKCFIKEKPVECLQDCCETSSACDTTPPTPLSPPTYVISSRQYYAGMGKLYDNSLAYINDKKYVYWSCVALDTLCQRIRPPNDVEMTAFALVHRLYCYIRIDFNLDMIPTILAAVYLAFKIYSDSYGSLSLSKLISIHSSGIDYQVSKLIDDSSNIQPKTDLEKNTLRKDIIRMEGHLLRATGYLEYMPIIPTASGGILCHVAEVLGLSKDFIDKAKRVVNDRAFRFSIYCISDSIPIAKAISCVAIRIANIMEKGRNPPINWSLIKEHSALVSRIEKELYHLKNTELPALYNFIESRHEVKGIALKDKDFYDMDMGPRKSDSTNREDKTNSYDVEKVAIITSTTSQTSVLSSLMERTGQSLVGLKRSRGQSKEGDAIDAASKSEEQEVCKRSRRDAQLEVPVVSDRDALVSQTSEVDCSSEVTEQNFLVSASESAPAVTSTTELAATLATYTCPAIATTSSPSRGKPITITDSQPFLVISPTTGVEHREKYTDERYDLGSSEDIPFTYSPSPTSKRYL